LGICFIVRCLIITAHEQCSLPYSLDCSFFPIGHYHLQKQGGYFGEVNVSAQIPPFRLQVILDKPLNPVKFCFLIFKMRLRKFDLLSFWSCCDKYNIIVNIFKSIKA